MLMNIFWILAILVLVGLLLLIVYILASEYKDNKKLEKIYKKQGSYLDLSIEKLKKQIEREDK